MRHTGARAARCSQLSWICPIFIHVLFSQARPSRLAEEDEDDVIYLSTFPRQPYHHTAVSTFRCPAIDSIQSQ